MYDYRTDWWNNDSLKRAEKPQPKKDSNVRTITWRCTRCDEIKARDEFYLRDIPPYVRQPCKACLSEQKRAKRLELKKVRAMSGEELREMVGG